MLNALAWMVVVLLVGPPLLVTLLILAGGFLVLTAAILPSTPRRVREPFQRPWIGRVLTADFLVREAAAHPSEIVFGAAFSDPQRTTGKRGRAETGQTSGGVLPRSIPPVGADGEGPGPVAARTRVGRVGLK